MFDVHKELLDLVSDVTNQEVAENTVEPVELTGFMNRTEEVSENALVDTEAVSENALVDTATTAITGGVAATGLVYGAAHAYNAIHAFSKKFLKPQRGDAVKHDETGQEGRVKSVQYNGMLNVDWHNGTNSSHEAHELTKQ